MAALDGKITIERELRPCMVKIPKQVKKHIAKPANTITGEMTLYTEEPEHEIKALFHCWDHRSELYDASPMIGGHPGGQVSGTFAIVEYEDGTIHEVEPTQIQFVDNAMREYAFPEAEENRDKSENEWKPLKRVNHVCPKCGQGRMKLDEGIVLTSNPPQYRYQCDKCGYVECSSGQIEVSEIDEI